MKTVNWFEKMRPLALTAALFCSVGLAAAQSQTGGQKVGPGNVIVHPALGGTIFGFDVDQNGTEGLLSESLTTAKDCLYATETFNQSTGAIVKVVRKDVSKTCGNDDVTWGVVGTSVGLVEHQRSPVFDELEMTFPVLNPLSGNKFTGDWKLKNKRDEIVAASRNQGTSMNAFQIFDFDTGMEYLIGSDVAANQIGPAIQVTSTYGIIGLNTNTGLAVVPIQIDGSYGPSNITQVDLTSGTQTMFTGIGSGQVLGLGVDSADNIAVTTTYGDSAVEFYDLANQTVIAYDQLPNCDNPACAGADVEFDPINKLFLVAQPITSVGVGQTSTIFVYNTQGDLIETLNNFNFYTQRFDVLPVHIALHPSQRSGFVDVTNSIGVGAIQSFTY
jgi:hypothetical protein